MARADRREVAMRIVIEQPVPGVRHSLQDKDGGPIGEEAGFRIKTSVTKEACSPAKAGVQSDRKPTLPCYALGPGFRRGSRQHCLLATAKPLSNVPITIFRHPR